MIKFISSDMAGAPALSGQAGKLIDVLDACLVNGFGSATVDSVVIAGGIATVTRAAGHPFEVGSIALIAGATVAGGSINGDQRVLSVTSTTYTFDATGLANQTATGTISHKVSPLGFAKTYSGTNLAAYKSSNVAATGCMLRVDDTGAQHGRVVGYQSMSDVNTGVGPFPSAGQVSGGGYWTKSSAADATARGWILCGDDRSFVLFINFGTTLAALSTSSYSYYFGDFNSLKSPDPYACTLTAHTSAVTGVSFNDVSSAYGSHGNTNQWSARGLSGVGSSAVQGRTAPFGSTSAQYFSGAGLMTYPAPVDNSLFVVPLYLSEGSPLVGLRGIVPGIYYSPQSIGTQVFAQKDRVDSITGLPGRTLRAICNGAGVLFVDITGPWR